MLLPSSSIFLQLNTEVFNNIFRCIHSRRIEFSRLDYSRYRQGQDSETIPSCSKEEIEDNSFISEQTEAITISKHEMKDM